MLSYTQKVWVVGFRPLIRQLNFYQPRLSVEMPSILVPWHIHVTNWAIHKVRTEGREESVQAKVYIHCFGDVILLLKCARGGGGQIFDLFKRMYFMDGPNSWKYYSQIFVASVVLTEADFPCFNLKPDDCDLATTILVHKLSQLHKTLILGRVCYNVQ